MTKKNQARGARSDKPGTAEREAASSGAARGGDEEVKEVAVDKDSDDEQVAEEEELEPEIAMLLGLAQMDAEASAAYLIIADGVSNPEIERTLKQFADDHERHLETISELVGDMTDAEQFEVGDPQGSTFVAMAEAMASIGPRAALRALKADELFTNAAYAAALEFSTDSDIREVLESHIVDEERHSRWLADTDEADWEDVEEGSGRAHAAE